MLADADVLPSGATVAAMRTRIAKASLMSVMYAYLDHRVSAAWLSWPLLTTGMTPEQWGESVIDLVTQCTPLTRADVLADWQRIGNRHINRLAAKLSVEKEA